MRTHKTLSPQTPLGASCEAFFLAALREEFGYIVETDNAFRARNTFYKFRDTNPTPEFKNITIRISPDKPETDLWLINLTGQKKLETDDIEL